jgi:hypothetical protein
MCSTPRQAYSQQLVKLWETDSTFKVPESTLYYPKENIIFVSNIDGKSNEKDLKGSISKLSPDGKTIKSDWAINLSAPKGMGIYKNSLYVADLDEVVRIDIATGKITGRIPVKGAIFLNDIAVDTMGTVFVSDSRTGKIHFIKNDTAMLYLENKIDVNGLLISGNELYFVAKDTLWKADKNKDLFKIADGMDASTDGIAQTSGGDLIVSCWNGIIYYIKKDGSKTVLTDLRKQQVNTADIGLDPKKNILYVPTFFRNKILAYQLQQ